MVWLKADAGLENTYKKLVYASKADVEWNGFILAENNTVILPGKVNSLIFDFDLKKVYPNIIDIPDMPADISGIDGKQLLKNIFNMTLYIFGKWGALQGIRVEHTYEKIDLLLKQILKEAGAEAYYSRNGIKFSCDSKSVVFEDIILAAINKIKEDERAEEEEPEDAGEEEYPQGLWHDMKWKTTSASFGRQDLDSSTQGKDRIGSNFYIIPYKCPQCGSHLHMSVYPDGKEFAIDTEEGKVYAARVYMCPGCSIFYTPRPGKLLSEGDEYILDFDNDAKAAEDYKKLIGRNGGKNSNSNTNMYEHEYAGKVHNGSKSLAKICRNIRRLSIADLERLLEEMDEGFYRGSEVKRFLEYIQQELEFRRNEQLDPYTAFRKGLKSGKIGEEGVAGGTERRRPDYSSIEDEEEPDSNDQEETEEETTEEDSIMEDIIKKYMGGGENPGEDIPETEQDIQNGENTPETVTENIKTNNPEDNTNIQEQPGKSTKKVTKAKSLFSKKNKQEEYTPATKTKPSDNIATSASKETENNTSSTPGTQAVQDEENTNTGYKKEQEPVQKQETAFAKEKDNNRTILNREDAVKKISAAKGKKYPEIERLFNEVKNSSLENADKEEFTNELQGMLEQAGKKELDYLISHLPQSDTKERYKRTRERIKLYKDIDTSKYEEIINKYIDNAEREELSSIVRKAAAGGRKSLLKALDDIKNKEFDLGVLKEYSDEIYRQVKDIDMETVRRIVPDISALDVQDGLRAIKEIEAADILPELKKEMSALIDKKLTRMKTEESGQLVEKIQRSLEDRIEDLSRIHYYDAIKMVNGDNKDEESLLIRKAISKYAILLGKYEYPVIIYDSSRFRNGKEGFIISPDHIFYKGVIKSGTLDIMDIDNISLENGKAGKAVFINNTSKRKIKLPCLFKGKDQENFAEILNEFAEYLKAKPKSRSVEYMAQEKHAAICCYRCGHVFKEGNICPKCGSRN